MRHRLTTTVPREEIIYLSSTFSIAWEITLFTALKKYSLRTFNYYSFKTKHFTRSTFFSKESGGGWQETIGRYARVLASAGSLSLKQVFGYSKKESTAIVNLNQIFQVACNQVYAGITFIICYNRDIRKTSYSS